MIRSKFIFTLGALMAVVAGVSSCANEEPGYHVADRSTLTLKLDPKSTQGKPEFVNLSVINAVNGTDTIFVDTKSGWKVEINSDTRPADQLDWTLKVGETVNDGTRSFFTITSSTNRGAQRTWENAFKVYVEGTDGEQLLPVYLTVRQEYSQIYPTPTSFETFSAAGGTGRINVDATGEWSVESYHEYSVSNSEGWITIDRTEKGKGAITFTVLPNRGTSIRSTALRFNDAAGATVAEITISQGASANVFDIGPDRSGRYSVGRDGGEVTLTVLSDKGWRADCAQAVAGGWLTVEKISTPMAGNTQGAGATPLKVTVTPNTGERQREAWVVFSRTEDSQTVASITVVITQEGTAEPARSEPWVSGVPTQTAVTLCGRYYSDDVTEAGIEIREEGKPDFIYMPNQAAADGEKGLVTVNITSADTSHALGYTGGRNYEMRLRVKTKLNTFYSSIVKFTSPGVVPSSGDNPTPGIK